MRRRVPYLLVFFGSLGVDLIPIMAPPVLGYTLSPLSTTALFTAAGMSKVRVWHLLPPFLAGKFVSDAMMVKAGEYAAGNLKDMLHGVFSAKNILIAAITLVLTAAFLFVDWHALLVKKTLSFNFSVFK